MIRVHTIISGGQTGADRGALDAAIALGLKHGGMAPAGWRAEDGEIPARYRVGMMQSGSAVYPVRTRSNVEASSGTLILSFGRLSEESGSMLTANFARRVPKPLLHILLPIAGVGESRLRSWLEKHDIRVLNVAGPRESREPGIQTAVCLALVAILREDDGFGGDE